MEQKKEVYVVQESALWSSIQGIVQHAVVQVFSHVSRFNWLEPFRIEAQYESRGTGFLIDDKGHIVTNMHIIDEAKRIWIHMPIFGQQPFHVHIVGVCPDRDLALLKLNEHALDFIKSALGGISYLRLGNSDLVQRADGILVLGYPLGQYRLKSTTGIVSGHELLDGRTLIQISAPVNQGNSGGPLFNISGEVIGIAIAAAAQTYNVGYAIPSNEFALIFEDLVKNSFVRKPFLGGRLVSANDEKGNMLKNPSPAGLYISTVFKDSLLERAGVKAGDMLYEFNGFPLDVYGDTQVPWRVDKTSLYELISRVKVGDMITLGIYRNGERKKLTCLCEITPIWPIRFIYPDFEPVSYEIIAGLVIMELRMNHVPLLSSYSSDLYCYNQPENRSEPVLIITHVFPGSYAYELRTLIPGDIIKQVNEKKVHTIAQLKRALLKSIETGYVVIHTKFDVLVVFSLARVLHEEERLSHNFFYPISKTVQQLQRAVKRTKA